MGEPAGIGPEITVKAWAHRRENHLSPFVYIGDPRQLAAEADRLGFDAPVKTVRSAAEAHATFADGIPVLALELEEAAVPGRPSRANAAAVLAAIDTAVELALGHEVCGIVTNPIHKAALYSAGFAHPGHTEYLAELVGRAGDPVQPVMMLVAPGLRAVPVTIHIPLREVPAALTTDRIVATCRTVVRDLGSRFGIARPRLAVAGLNPHAGEAGALGSEDLEIIAPAVAALRAEGVDVSGPLPADTMFHSGARRRYDAAICMYHDQALIPIKTLGFADGVNCTLGLPFVRTSPDHGTALDIAGGNIADPSSLIAALRLTDRMARLEAAARRAAA